MLNADEIRAKKRHLAVLYADTPLSIYYTEATAFTCDECGANDSCGYAYDAYNTNGDCLEEK